jgi:endogenous inhibitor of DNA gyrase (YacG/DUF329 family)
MPTTVKCPGCGRELAWNPGNKWRPFCSERCKLIDLGAWFSEAHAIPGEPALDLPDDPDDDHGAHH